MSNMVLHEDLTILLEHLKVRGIEVDTLLMNHIVKINENINDEDDYSNAVVHVSDTGVLSVEGEGIEIHTYVENLFGNEPPDKYRYGTLPCSWRVRGQTTTWFRRVI